MNIESMTFAVAAMLQLLMLTSFLLLLITA